MVDPHSITIAAALAPLFIATYYFGKMNGKEQTLEAVLYVLIQEGMIVDDEDISSESDQD